jgi:hypothetical protein
MATYADQTAFLEALNTLYRSKAQINAGGSKNDPDDIRTLLTNVSETLFANAGGGSSAPTVITTVSQDLTFGSNQVMAIDNRSVQADAYVNYSFTLSASGNTPGYVIQFYIQADGSGTFTFSSDFVILNSSITSGGTLTADVTYLFSFLYDGDKVLVNVVETNAAAIDNTAPTLTSATIATDSVLDLVFDEAVTITTAGWIIATDGAALSISAVASGSGTTTPKLTLSRSVLESETVTVSYASSTGNTVDASGNELADITDRAVTNNVSNNNAITSAALSKMSTLGYTGPSGTNLTAINTFIQSLVDDGIISEAGQASGLLDVLYIWCGDGDANSKTINWIDPNLHQGTNVNSPTYDNFGIKGNGTSSYFDTNYAPFDDGVNYTQNNSSMIVDVLEVTTDALKILIGSSSINPFNVKNLNSTFHRINNTGGSSGASIDFSSTGLFVLDRQDSTNIKGYVNSTTPTNTTQTADSIGSTGQNLWFLAWSSGRSNAKFAVGAFGSSVVSKITELKSAIDTLRSSIV